jgi:cytidylate kinase
MEHEDIPKGEAEALVRERDKVRAAFVRSWYGANADEAGLFDLVIDTSKVPADVAVGWLVEMARVLDARKTDHGRTTLGIQVDPALASIVSRKLNCEATHR